MRTRLLGPVRSVTPGEAGDALRRARRILLVKPHHRLGDLLVATPVIRNLRLALPSARMIFVAGTYNAPAVLDNPDLDRVEIAGLRGPAAPIQFLRMVHRLRREEFDFALVLSTISHSWTAVALARQARPSVLAGLDDSAYGSDLALRGYDCVLAPPEDRKQIHIVDYNLMVLERLGVPIREREHVLAVTPEQRKTAEEHLTRAGVDRSRPVLGIQLGGNRKYPDRMWAPSNYAAISKRAEHELGYQTVLLGQSEDRDDIGDFSGFRGEKCPALLDLPFPEYKAVLAELTFFVTHDGGPVHVAAGVRVPGYYLFLWTSPKRWSPYGSHVHVWEDHKRTPAAEEVWERLAPLLVRAYAARFGDASRSS